MANHGPVQRLSTTAATTSTSPPLPTTQPHEPKDSTPRVKIEFTLLFPFNIPKSPASRIFRNLSYYRLYYTLFIWIILFITIVPQRKLSLIFLIAMTALTCSLLAVMRLVPVDFVVLQYKIIDRRLILALLVIATMVELIVTEAAKHLFLTLACVTSVILVHAVFRVRDDVCVEEEASAAGELVPLVRYSEPKESDSV